ncbi:MAG: protein kinase [Myxococcales bacterium]
MTAKDRPGGEPAGPSDSDELTTAVPTAISIPFGKYELLQCIAAGGMGEVFLARELGRSGYDKLLVIKVLLPHLVKDPEFVRLFLDEARIAAQLNHPHIAAIYDLGQNEGSYFIAMEYVHGESLEVIERQAYERGRKVPLKILARLIADAASGLEYAHHAKDPGGRPLHVIHRDISPQNVLVGFDGGVKIIDFGIAKAAGRSSQTRVGVVRGKIPYMSPEQAAGLRIDHRTDVFALGVVFFELATGKRLFPYTNDLKTLALVTRCEVPQPSTLEPDVDPVLESVMLKALAKDPQDRYQTAGELRAALEDWLAQGGETVAPTLMGAFMSELFSERLQLEKLEGKSFTSAKVVPSEIFAGQTGQTVIPSGPLVRAPLPSAPQPHQQPPPPSSPPKTAPAGPRPSKKKDRQAFKSTVLLARPSLGTGGEAWQYVVLAALALVGAWLLWARFLESGTGAMPAVAVEDSADSGPEELEVAEAPDLVPDPPDAAKAAAPKSKADLAFEEAVLHFEQKRFAAAAKLFQSVVDAEPNRARAHLLLGTSLARLRRWEEAAHHYEDFVRLAPNDPMTPEVLKRLKAYYARPKRRK